MVLVALQLWGSSQVGDTAICMQKMLGSGDDAAVPRDPVAVVLVGYLCPAPENLCFCKWCLNAG